MMIEYPGISLIMATYTEAKPFVEKIRWSSSVKEPFPIYYGRDLTLAISGIGKTNAAMACTWLCMTCAPGFILNIGAAGANPEGLPAGSIHHIGEAVETDRLDFKTNEPFRHQADVIEGFSTVRLATSDQPVTEPPERHRIASLAELSDMEGAAVIQAARRFRRRCFVFKFVSDTPKHTSGDEIVANIRHFRESVFDFYLDEIKPKIF